MCLENGVVGTDPLSGESSSIADSETAELGSDEAVDEAMEARRSRGKKLVGPAEVERGEPERPSVEMDMRRRGLGVGRGAVVEDEDVVVEVLLGLFKETVEEGGEGFWRGGAGEFPLVVVLVEPRGPKMAEKVALEKEPRRRSGVGVGVSSVIVVVCGGLVWRVCGLGCGG